MPPPARWLLTHGRKNIVFGEDEYDEGHLQSEDHLRQIHVGGRGIVVVADDTYVRVLLAQDVHVILEGLAIAAGVAEHGIREAIKWLDANNMDTLTNRRKPWWAHRHCAGIWRPAASPYRRNR